MALSDRTVPGQDSDKSSLPEASTPDRWVEAYGDFLFSFAMLRLRDAATAQDVVQDTFLAGLAARSAYRAESAERAWLLGILKHKIQDVFRERSRHPLAAELAGDDTFEKEHFRAAGLGGGAWLEQTAPADWPDSRVDALDRPAFWMAFQSCLSKLPVRTARAFQLREVDQLESGAVCELLGITENNLWVQLHRARLSLRRCLEVNWFKRLDE